MTRPNPSSSSTASESNHHRHGLHDTLAKALGLDGSTRVSSTTGDHLSFSLYCPADPGIVKDLSHRLPDACASLCANHFWSSGHPLVVSPMPLSSTQGVNAPQAHLLASSRLPVAECIDDEWFALWALKSLTRQFAPHLALTVSDADGQFELIEAAEHLPDWVDPDSVEHRVWWAHGQLLLISPSLADAIATEADGAAKALDRSQHPQLLAPEPVRQHLDALFRTVEYAHTLDSDVPPPRSEEPCRLPSTRFHRTHMYLPRLAASLLSTSVPISRQQQQQLLAFAVHAVHTRDPVSMRQSRDMPLLIPTTPSSIDGNWVKVPVCLTRYLFALLDSTRVDPFPDALAQAFPAHVPPSLVQADSKGADASARKACRAWHNGAKLALGLEMVLGGSASLIATTSDGWTEARRKVVEYLHSPETPLSLAVDQCDVGNDDDDAWMQVTDEDLQRWSSQSKEHAGRPLGVTEVVKAVDAFGEGESGLDGIADSTAADTEDQESDDDELLFDPDKFDALFSVRDHTAPGSRAAEVQSDSDSDLEDMMAENLPGFPGADGAEGSGEVDEMQVLANLLASLDGQEGRMGPAAGLLAHLGFPLVPGAQEASSDEE